MIVDCFRSFRERYTPIHENESGQALWANIPLVYREQATVHTDQYRVYKGVIPAR